jgi:hypothetical protein
MPIEGMLRPICIKRRTMDDLESLPDDELWAIVRRPFSSTQDERLRELTARGKNGTLSDDEQIEIEQLVDAVDRYVLLRSQALLLLEGRGHNVEAKLSS